MRWTWQALGTTVELVTQEETADAGEVFTAVGRKLADYERLLSRFIPDSDVSRLNAHAGAWTPVAPATMEVLLLAESAYQATCGLFDPCLGAVLEQLGYDRDFATLHTAPAGAPYRAPCEDAHTLKPPRPVAPSSCHPLSIRPEAGCARMEPGYKLDLGGIAKGWIVERIAEDLEDAGFRAFVVSAGGDMVCRGGPWHVGVEHPFVPGSCIASWTAADVAVATSGTYRRRWRAGGRPVHHLIDPRTGQPSSTDVIACTVVHPSLVQAEVLAKAAVLLGSNAAPAWLAAPAAPGWEPAIGWFIVRQDGTTIASRTPA
ncbi:FAD:protein FMN transferase [Alicyclobacillus cellulosilyticus]|uniref:FAD:protein FMN transferase n=1 Tax=Alicyclobacillus cellulosilyticus TaxID=1003997 RepID=A0A917KEK2_9BACL|nr:FAD:protein FMN transferase [Alicyclobacillus cellulosilyticus]GGJ11217.1 FAD:protein FMN transferase [Alicyclobacillus cellulosilyticus]